MPIITVTDPLVSCAIGVALFGEVLHLGGVRAPAVLLAIGAWRPDWSCSAGPGGRARPSPSAARDAPRSRRRRVVFSADDRQQILDLIDGALVSGDLTLGPLTEELRSRLRRPARRPAAGGDQLGTSALEIALRADRRGRAGEVIVPANTFFATAAAVVHAGGRAPLRRHRSRHPGAVGRDRGGRPSTPQVVAVIHVHIGGSSAPRWRPSASSATRQG